MTASSNATDKTVVERLLSPIAEVHRGETLRVLVLALDLFLVLAAYYMGVNFGSTNAKRDIPMYAQLYLQGRMNLDDLVSKRIALREVNDGYAALKDGTLNRVVVTSF